MLGATDHLTKSGSHNLKNEPQKHNIMSSMKARPYNPALTNGEQPYTAEEPISVEATPAPNVEQEGAMITQQAPSSSPPDQTPTAVKENSKTPTIENPRYIGVDSRKPVVLSYCPNCAKEHVATSTRTKATGTTWLLVAAGVVVFWPLCWVPLVVNPMKQTDHYCQGCGAKVGRVKPFH